MTQLPDECLSEIFLNLEGQYKNLFSCLLVNRQWCRNVVPILWSEPEFFKNCKLVRTCLLALNSEERALLTSHNIMLQDDQNPFFDYPRYITAIYILTDTGIINWFKNEVVSSHNSTHVKIDSKSPKVQIIRYALTIMLLRKTEKPKYLRVYGPIHNKMVDLLAKIFIHNKTLTFLSLEDNKLTSKIRKLLVESLCKNTTLTHLDFSNNKLDSERGKILAEALGGNALAKALSKNISLAYLDLSNNNLDSGVGKPLKDALSKNTTLISLELEGAVDFVCAV
ncbi:f-box domain-containing protein [Gigaspora margarita]|uniref:F-box domain-containing protein n=1 Tax=Gigaspora margarita TaxID=4874 RepID=A0A8H4ET79_GIGMA|nr:f-box domain-containing protein [Gigaspora margarita]